MPTRLAFSTDGLAGAAVIPGLSARNGFSDGLLVHVSNHQHIARFGVRHNHGNQSARVELRCAGQAFLDVSRFIRHGIRAPIVTSSRIAGPGPATTSSEAGY